jgi:hypothetical protein
VLASRLCASGCAAQSRDEASHIAEHHLVSLPDEGSEDVFADRIAPEMVGAVAAWEGVGVEIHPVWLRASREVIAAVANSLAVQTQTALETRAVHPSGRVKIDGRPRPRFFYFAHAEILSNFV